MGCPLESNGFSKRTKNRARVLRLLLAAGRLAHHPLVYRSSDGQLTQRVRDLESEIAELLAEKAKLVTQEGHRTARKEALAAAHRRLTELMWLVEQKQRLVHAKRSADPAVRNQLEHGRAPVVCLVGAPVTWFTVFVLSGESLAALGAAGMLVILSLIIWSGWRGEGL